jgi:hypothetical protein
MRTEHPPPKSPKTLSLKYSAFGKSVYTYKRCWNWCPRPSVQTWTRLILFANTFCISAFESRCGLINGVGSDVHGPTLLRLDIAIHTAKCTATFRTHCTSPTMKIPRGTHHWIRHQNANGKSNPITGLGKPWGFQQAEVPRFRNNRDMKVGRLSAQCTGRLTPQEIFISVRGWVHPRAIMQPKINCPLPPPISATLLKILTLWLSPYFITKIEHITDTMNCKHICEKWDFTAKYYMHTDLISTVKPTWCTFYSVY